MVETDIFLTSKSPLLKGFKNIEKIPNEEDSYWKEQYERAASRTNPQLTYGERKERQLNLNIRGMHKILQKRLFSPLTIRLVTLQLSDRLHIKNR